MRDRESLRDHGSMRSRSPFRMQPRRFRAWVLALLVAASAQVVPLASAVEAPVAVGLEAPSPRAVSRTGRCTGPSHWKIVVRKGDAGQLIVVLTVAGGAAGQKWHIFMDNKGRAFFQGSRTSGDNGFFRVRAKTRNLAGQDKITAAANNTKTGENCTAGALF